MDLRLKISSPNESNQEEEHVVSLSASSWDDYSFKTSFQATYVSPSNVRIELGTVKIGFVDQPVGWTKDKLKEQFDQLDSNWFSLGQDVEYYRTIQEKFPEKLKQEFLARMRDVAVDESIYDTALHEKVFQQSLLRSVSPSVIHGQYRRVLAGLPALSEFKFLYRDDGGDDRAKLSLGFHVRPETKPPTNVHVIIGRNGIGKTTLLNNMVCSVLSKQFPNACSGKFYLRDRYDIIEKELPDDYFSSLVSVSFSAFDPFVPPADQPDRSKGLKYFYIGMKKRQDVVGGPRCIAKSQEDFTKDILDSIEACLSQSAKRERWFSAILRLESDPNFKDIGFSALEKLSEKEILVAVASLVKEMSSGHSIVLLTLSKLVETVEEKTLVLMDEPESHLHPPLLSALTRAISDLLHDRNAVAIIATHSPVIVQEVPGSCVWIITRSGNQARSDRPEGETFGENVGVLTREIFGLEVAKSGFHSMLQESVDRGKDFEGIMSLYNDQLGFEAQAIVRAMIRVRENSVLNK